MGLLALRFMEVWPRAPPPRPSAVRMKLPAAPVVCSAALNWTFFTETGFPISGYLRESAATATIGLISMSAPGGNTPSIARFHEAGFSGFDTVLARFGVFTK